MLEHPQIHVDALDSDQSTALSMAVRYGHLEVAKALLKKGASPTVKLPHNLSILELAHNPANKIVNPKMVKLIEDALKGHTS